MQTAFDQGLARILGPVIDFLGTDLFAILAGLIVALGLAQVNALFLVWLERKLAGHFQLRIGPKEHGPFGLLQTIIDGIKLLVKDLVRPRSVDWPMYALAPIIILVPPLVAFVVLPFGPLMIIRDMSVGFLLIFAFGSLTVLALLMGG
ncbi:MAG: NADH-quinone oxidoreductase subunit H, partial [Proteobacteria bacterium]|nr:NADH-quinone oxidoreductase subunit H [Pseudomonadota bacterium]